MNGKSCPDSDTSDQGNNRKKHTQTHTKIPHIPVHITDILYILIKTAMHKKEEKKSESMHLKQDEKKMHFQCVICMQKSKRKKLIFITSYGNVRGFGVVLLNCCFFLFHF